MLTCISTLNGVKPHGGYCASPLDDYAHAPLATIFPIAARTIWRGAWGQSLGSSKLEVSNCLVCQEPKRVFSDSLVKEPSRSTSRALPSSICPCICSQGDTWPIPSVTKARYFRWAAARCCPNWDSNQSTVRNGGMGRDPLSPGSSTGIGLGFTAGSGAGGVHPTPRRPRHAGDPVVLGLAGTAAGAGQEQDRDDCQEDGTLDADTDGFPIVGICALTPGWCRPCTAPRARRAWVA